ncbi:MAG: prepilin-type N-terminal cleavage/methylation domain-containing protein, partial [Planctomycetia bacterium]|nr:prepilin-type N-terminal cleavage/methylation domain-containing protein [Planctomycetia bacterium]
PPLTPNPSPARGEGRRHVRRAFTLLEMLLATAIAVLLFGALYVAMEAHLRHVDAGREIVEESVLARSLLARIANDISVSLPPMPPPKASSSGGSTSGGSATANTNTGATGSAAPTGGMTASSSTSAVQFNLGVQGDTERLVLFITRLPRELNEPTTGDTGANPVVVSDLRRVTYWLAGGSSSPQGLGRQETRLATADEPLPPDGVDEAALIIAEEVKSLQFRYFDGSAWQDFWDGAALGADGKTPVGPPLAIEVRIGIAPAPRPGQPGWSEETLRYHRHVVAIPTAQSSANLEP